MKATKLLLITIFLFIPFIGKADNLDQMFDQLDQVVEQNQVYVNKKEAELTRLRQNFHAASMDLDKYLTSKQLIEAYLKFNSDSADRYSKICLSYALKTKNKDWETEATIYMALSYAMHGEVQQAISVMKGYDDIDAIPASLKELYAKAQFCIALKQEDAFATPQLYYANNNRVWNLYKDYIPANDPGRCYFEVFKESRPNDALLNKVLKLLAKAGNAPSIKKSLYEQCATMLYSRKGDSIAALKYAIRAAITDIKIANRDESSLLYIVNRLELGQQQSYKNLRRELNYIRLSADNVRTFRDFNRSLWLIVSQGLIQEDSYSYSKMETRRYTVAVIALSVLLIAALVALFLLWRRMRRSHDYHQDRGKKLRKLMAQKTDDDNELASLRSEVERLRELIARRDKSYLDGIMLNVNVISKAKEKVQKMQNFAAVKKWSNVNSMLNDELFDDDEYKEISNSIDNIILTVMPDFVEKFNTLLKPDAQITLDSPDHLTPALRIYGLISLGLTDMGSIAEILHYSPQTIYNYRLKMRRSAVVPEKQFDDAVMKLFEKY